jgi:hypothetical protein
MDRFIRSLTVNAVLGPIIGLYSFRLNRSGSGAGPLSFQERERVAHRLTEAIIRKPYDSSLSRPDTFRPRT